MTAQSASFFLRIGHALRDACFGDEPYTLARLQQDVLAGITVGIIAIPLAMALAIASGVAPQYGLYTAIIGGFVIALTGGSRYSVSGPNRGFCRPSLSDCPALRTRRSGSSHVYGGPDAGCHGLRPRRPLH